MRVSSTEVQNNFGKYMSLASDGEEVIVTRNGKDVIRLQSYNNDSYVSEEAPVYATDNQKRMSYEEFLELTENSDLRYELIDGELIELTAPNYAHQVAVLEIIGTFYNWFKGKACRPLTSPFDVTLFKSKENVNVVQPDIIVMCDTENINQKGKYMGVPTLVVEVLSESTRRYDLLKKLNLYMECGIKEYWIADPGKKEIYVYIFSEQDVADYSTYRINDKLESKTFEGLAVDLGEVFGA